MTIHDFMVSMTEDPLGMLPLVTPLGSPGVLPGETTEVTYMLEPGEHVLLNFGSEMPQYTILTVQASNSADLPVPEADVNVTMVDFGYGVPLTISAGEHLWHIGNAGEQWHELAIALVEPGTTLDDVRALLVEGEESPLEPLPLLMPLDSGLEVFVTVDLEPGHHALICNLPHIMEGAEGHLHHELSMLQLVTVANMLTYEDPSGLFTLAYSADLTAYAATSKKFTRQRPRSMLVQYSPTGHQRATSHWKFQRIMEFL